MNNAIAKKVSSATNQIIAIERDETKKARHVHLGKNRWRTPSLRWFFDVIPMILLEFSLRLTIP